MGKVKELLIFNDDLFSSNAWLRHELNKHARGDVTALYHQNDDLANENAYLRKQLNIALGGKEETGGTLSSAHCFGHGGHPERV